jgi:hypothetical protein
MDFIGPGGSNADIPCHHGEMRWNEVFNIINNEIKLRWTLREIADETPFY